MEQEYNPLKDYLEGNDVYLTELELEMIVSLSGKMIDFDKNKGFYPDRLNEYNPRELAFYHQWQKENLPESWINHGHGILQDLFIRRKGHNELSSKECLHELTNIERKICATLIQWLGTNCGMAFLGDALKRCGYEIKPIK